MGMTPDEFFETFVLGNYKDFTERPDCVRRGFNAAIAAWHMAEHCFKYYKRNDPAKIDKFETLDKYRAYISEQTLGHFNDIRGIAEAYKHLYTWENVCIASTGAIEALEIKGKHGNVSEVISTRSEVTNKRTVMFTRRTGEQRELLPALESVINFWQEELRKISADISIVP